VLWCRGLGKAWSGFGRPSSTKPSPETHSLGT
jgi:hypothetical protein